MSGIGDRHLALLRRNGRQAREHDAGDGLRHRKTLARRRLDLRHAGIQWQDDADQCDNQAQSKHRKAPVEMTRDAPPIEYTHTGR